MCIANVLMDFGPQINSGFFNSVHRMYDEDAVIKIPKITSLLVHQTLENIQYALTVHQETLGEYLPKTEILPMKGAPLGYIFKQKYIQGTRLTTADCKEDANIAYDLVSLLAAGEYMETKYKLYFDIYGMEEAIKNVGRLAVRKDLVFGNIIVDSYKKLHYIDVGYIRTDQIGFVNPILTQLMHTLGGI